LPEFRKFHYELAQGNTPGQIAALLKLVSVSQVLYGHRLSVPRRRGGQPRHRRMGLHAGRAASHRTREPARAVAAPESELSRQPVADLAGSTGHRAPNSPPTVRRPAAKAPGSCRSGWMHPRVAKMPGPAM